jgi:drug/metabolite transporter (DMT)-like permease
MAVPLGVALLLVVQAAVWGSAFPAIKLGLVDLSAPHFTLLRHLIASAAFVPLLLAFRARLVPRREHLPAFFGLGLCGFTLYHLALNYGSLHVSAGAASLIIATAPAMTAILAALVESDKLPALGWVGSAVSFAGVALIVMADGRQAATEGFTLYAWFIVVSAAATSAYAVFQRRMFAHYRPIEVAGFSTWAGTLPMLVFLPGLAGAVGSAGRASLGAALYAGLLPSAVAYTMFAIALSRANVTVVTAFLYLVPVFALVTAWFLLGEVPPLLTIVGGALAIAGVVVLNRAKRAAARTAAAAAT